jgi:5'-nucleotidase
MRIAFAVILLTLSSTLRAADTSGNPWPPPEQPVEWSGRGANRAGTVHLQLLGFNDFHGNLQSPEVGSSRPVGGAAALAAYLKAAERAVPDRTLILHAGDQLGASPPATRLLHNEPGIEFLNLLANRYCRYGDATRAVSARGWRAHPNRCNVVGTLGNHEFDAGIEEIHRLLEGGDSADGPFLENPFRGSRVPYVCSNVRDRRSGRLLLPAYTVVSLGGIPVGVIGAVLRETPSIVPAWAVRDVEFLDEAQSINQAAAELEAQGIHTLIVIIHQGLTPVVTDKGYEFRGPLRELIARLDPDIDVVISGHTHNFTNALLPSRDGTPILVTQAYSYGVAFARIDLTVDPRTRDVVAKSARIVPTWADVSPGLEGDTKARKLTDASQALVAARVSRVVGILQQPMRRAVSAAGESALGDLVADAQREATHADIALMNPGGLRSDLAAGPVTFGDVLTLHPFANHLVTLEMTGAQLLAVLEQQWPREGTAAARILKTSGLRYSWDATRGAGEHVRAACDASEAAIDPQRHYRVTVNDFLAAGGDDFSALVSLGPGEVGPSDSEALDAYLHLHNPAAPPEQPRLSRVDLGGSKVCPLP